MRKPRILFVDSYYPEVLREHDDRLRGLGYKEALARLLGLRFGTADFVSKAMEGAGWEAEDLVANSEGLKRAYRSEHGVGELPGEETFILRRVSDFKPDVVAVQTIGLLSRKALESIKREGVRLALFASYAMSPDAPVELYDVLFTSFPHYEAKYGKRTRFVFLPLAFGKGATEGLGEPPRDLPVTFVGGLGHRSIWHRAHDVLEILAARVPEFRWWGYGEALLPENSCLRKAWQGRAWGRDMYAIYLRSKIVVNRHGEIAQGYTNNMRLFEATGAGALLVTEEAPNLHHYFMPGEVATYRSAEELVSVIRSYLADPEALARTARAGQGTTLSRHTFDARAPEIDRVLLPLIEERLRP